MGSNINQLTLDLGDEKCVLDQIYIPQKVEDMTVKFTNSSNWGYKWIKDEDWMVNMEVPPLVKSLHLVPSNGRETTQLEFQKGVILKNFSSVRRLEIIGRIHPHFFLNNMASAIFRQLTHFKGTYACFEVRSGFFPKMNFEKN